MSSHLRLFSGLIAVLFAGSLTAPANAAVFTYSGDITYATDYIFRGVSQTEERAAVQGGYVLDTGFGLQFGTWGSNINFPGSEASMELDSFVSFGFDLRGDLGLEVGAVDYRYPGDSALNFSEIFVNLSILGFSFNAYRSDDYEASGAAALWTRFGYEIPLLLRNLQLGVEYGTVEADKPIFTQTTGTESNPITESKDNYSHLGVYLSLTVVDSELRLSFADANRLGCGSNCSSLLAVSWTKSF